MDTDTHITIPMARMIELETAEHERAIFRSERLDLALLVGRLIRRMRAARTGEGIAAGDDALEQQCIGYLRRKGLASPLRDEPAADSKPPCPHTGQCHPGHCPCMEAKA